MSDCVDGNCVVESGNSKIEAFDFAIGMCDRFHIAGLNENETSFVLRDTNYDEGIEGSFVEVSIQEVEDVPLDSILKTLKGERNDIVVKGYTRIVGYYSGVHNWNASKLSELNDRHEGQYSSPGFVAKNKDASSGAVNKLRVAYGT